MLKYLLIKFARHILTKTNQNNEESNCNFSHTRRIYDECAN